MRTELRERLGKLVRATWINWAKEQPSPKPSWLLPWEELSEPDKEVDRQIGEKLFHEGLIEAMPHLRHAWEAGFKLAVQYGDNHTHFDGEQKERQWKRYSEGT